MEKTKKVKKPKPFGCAACPWGHDKEEMFVQPEEHDDPNIIILVEAPGETEWDKGFPLAGKSGKLMRRMFRDLGAKPVIVNSANCFNEAKPPTKVINACREAYVKPILDKYPTLPILACGQFAAGSILGGKRSDKSMAGHVWRVGTHDVYFTYHPAYYLYSHDDFIIEHIKTLMRSALTEPFEPIEGEDYEYGLPEDWEWWQDANYFYIDCETTGVDYPWYDSQPVIMGIMNDLSDKVYILKAENKEYLQKLTIFRDFGGTVVGHNLPFDLAHGEAMGIQFPKAGYWDCLQYEELRPLPERSKTLKWFAKNRFGLHGYEAKVHGQWEVEGKNSAEVDLDDLSKYCATDVYVTRELHRYQLAEQE